ncbi:hypothetical protein QAD02_021835 [Eretmocerus hayati]|uniref:Uncharacterized protein n=1 Tax=Eretmocerus hayati TaxID=131215 RepID=A0ACC2PRM1_9HYME|nr:hypothetical protein QAD02_021835 [Eretmocerus hayati]
MPDRQRFDGLAEFHNGLVADPLFYAKTKSGQIAIARYVSSNTPSNGMMIVTGNDIARLVRGGWLLGETLDYLLAQSLIDVTKSPISALMTRIKLWGMALTGELFSHPGGHR